MYSVGWVGRSVALVTRDLNMVYQTPARLPVLVVPTTGRLKMAERYAEVVAAKLREPRLAVEYHALDPLDGEDLFEHRQRQVAAIKRHQQRQPQQRWSERGRP